MRWLLYISGTMLALYLVLVGYVYAFQSKLVFFPNVPGRAVTATPAEIGLAFEEVRIAPANGLALHAWFVPAAPGATTVLVCHGNAGNISHRLDLLGMFHELGLAVLLFDYRGYGQSEGMPSEQGTYEDARAAWDYLTQVRRIPAASIVIFGESLGAPVAAHLAQTVSPGGLIVTSAFTSAPDLASTFYWYLPVRWLARIQYPTAEYISRVRAPVLVIHSREDEIVPFSHGEALYRHAAEPKAFLEIRGGHDTGLAMSRSLVMEGLQRFLEAHRLIGRSSVTAG